MRQKSSLMRKFSLSLLLVCAVAFVFACGGSPVSPPSPSSSPDSSPDSSPVPPPGAGEAQIRLSFSDGYSRTFYNGSKQHCRVTDDGWVEIKYRDSADGGDFVLAFANDPSWSPTVGGPYRLGNQIARFYLQVGPLSYHSSPVSVCPSTLTIATDSFSGEINCQPSLEKSVGGSNVSSTLSGRIVFTCRR